MERAEVEPIDNIRWAGIEELAVFNVREISSRACEWEGLVCGGSVSTSHSCSWPSTE